MIKALGLAIMARKEELYELNYLTGATRKDGWIDIEGGAGTLFSFSSKGRRELPDAHVLLDGQLEGLSKNGTFVGQHIYTPLQGAAVHINAFNFPVWGMLEKLAPTIARRRSGDREAGLGDRLSRRSRVPDHDRGEHASAGRDPADRRRRRRPVRPSDRPGRRQLHRLGARPRSSCAPHPTVIRESVRFVAEQDSLNASLLGPDAAPGTPEFDLFVKEVATEMTVKAGQKCTAIRRAMAPAEYLDAVEQALARAAGEDQGRRPARRGHAHGRAGQHQPARRRSRADRASSKLRARASSPAIPNAEPPIAGGAFLPPMLLRTDDPWEHGRGPRLRAVRAGLDDHALQGHRRRDRARQSRQGQPRAVAVHPFARRRARVRPGRGRLSRPDAGHRPHQRRRNRPATARRCRCSSTAAPAAPAAARRWAACAASSITCSAPRSSPRRR